MSCPLRRAAPYGRGQQRSSLWSADLQEHDVNQTSIFDTITEPGPRCVPVNRESPADLGHFAPHAHSPLFPELNPAMHQVSARAAIEASHHITGHKKIGGRKCAPAQILPPLGMKRKGNQPPFLPLLGRPNLEPTQFLQFASTLIAPATGDHGRSSIASLQMFVTGIIVPAPCKSHGEKPIFF